MASGDLIAMIYAVGVPSSNPATPDYTAGPYPVTEFDDTTTESIYYYGYMSGVYDGTSNITVKWGWKFATFVGSQTCDWEWAWYRIADDADTIESFTFATAQATLATEASAAGELDYATRDFTNAQADGIQPNEYFVLRGTRDATGGTASPGDAQLSFPVVEYT